MCTCRLRVPSAGTSGSPRLPRCLEWATSSPRTADDVSAATLFRLRDSARSTEGPCRLKQMLLHWSTPPFAQVARDLKIRVSVVRFRPKPLATSMTSAARHAST